ncbi:MAG: hypothetical protein JO269_09675 [Burkholderiaceae bacterium]|nr:hypothetical protein [Burkholderiaceae bacterium]
MSDIKTEFFPFKGGLDLMTPPIALDPGKCFDAQNYEPVITGGYARIYGFERFDGHQSPSTASYWILPATISGTINIGDTVTGATSGATAKVLAIYVGVVGEVAQNYLVVGRLSGVFVSGENLTDSGVQAVTTGTAQQNGALLPLDDANYTLLAANDLRTSISAVPGSGSVRGVKYYNGNVYAFRDNIGATAALMYKATSTGWSQVNFGLEIKLTTLVKSATVTMTTASPTVVTDTAHGMAAGQPVQFSISAGGTLPTGIAANFTYYLVPTITANTFEIAATLGGTPINVTGAGSGTITCTAMGNNIYAGNTITGVTSGATATVAASLLMTGSWTTNLVGTLVIASQTGTFQSGEILSVGNLLLATTASAAVQITRLPGGQMEFCNINFSGSATGYKMYGVDGVNPAFEFDGANYVPIHTGATVDTPAHVINFKEMLFLAQGGNLNVSSIANPYNYDANQSAGVIGVGDLITGFVPQGGTYVTGSTMAIFSTGHMFTLYGSSVANFNLITSIWDMGFSPFTMQTVSNDTYGWTSRGIQTVISTLTFGDFDYNSVSHEIQTLINKKQGLAISSTSLHQKNQYRVYFSDGTGLAVGLTGQTPNGIMPLNYGLNVRCICTDTNAAGQEVTYFGSDNGFVYQDNVGTSLDGNPIEAWLRLPFNHSKSPRVRKRYRRAVFEGYVNAYAQVNFSYDLGYGDPNVQPSAPVPDTSLGGASGYWDQFTWDQFTWDSQVVGTPQISLQGTEKNISFLLYSNYAQFQPHTFQGLTLIYSPQRLER